MLEISYSQFPFSITPGQDIQQNIGFNPLFAIVSNYSPYYIYFPDALSYCPPWTVGAVIGLSHANSARATWSQSPFGAQTISVSTIPYSATISFTDDPRLGTVGGSPILDPTLQGAASWYSTLGYQRSYFASSFRTLGDATTAQNLLSIQNTDSSVLVGIRQIKITLDHTAALTTVAPYFRLKNLPVTGGGTSLTKFLYAPTQSPNSSAGVTILGATASDGGVATPILAPLTNDPIRQQFASRMHTAVGDINSEFPIILWGRDDPPYVMSYQLEAILVRVEAAVGTSNPTTNHYLVEIEWDESPNPLNL